VRNLLRLVIALRGRKKLSTPHLGWVDHLIPWNHAFCGGVSAAVGLIHVHARFSMNFPSRTLLLLPCRPPLALIMGITVGGLPHSCALASSVASCHHDTGPLYLACFWLAPSFGKVAVATPDFRSLSQWLVGSPSPRQVGIIHCI
jgi:hypothetical protein